MAIKLAPWSSRKLAKLDPIHYPNTFRHSLHWLLRKEQEDVNAGEFGGRVNLISILLLNEPKDIHYQPLPHALLQIRISG